LLEAFDNTPNFQLSVLNEVYFCKTKGLQKIEKLLDEYRNKYMGKINFVAISANEDKLLLQINREFEKEFGFSEFAISVIDSGMVYAFTLPIGARFDNKHFGNTGKDLAVNAKTFKFKKEAGYAAIVCIYAGLIFNKNYTTEEIMAIILHEVGHNFQEAISNINVGFSNFGKVSRFVEIMVTLIQKMDNELKNIVGAGTGATLGLMLTTNALMKPLIAGYKYAMEFKDDFYEMTLMLASTANMMIDLIGLGFKLFDIFTFGIFKYLSLPGLKLNLGLFGLEIGGRESLPNRIKNIVTDPFGMLNLPGSYRHERTADNFTTFYGYGPALSSAMTKMGYSGNTANDIMNSVETIPIYSTLMNAFTLPANVIMNALDPYPLHLTRIQDQINLLEAELKKPGIDPKMRKRIQKDIDAIKPAIKDSTNITKGFKDPDLAKHALNKVLYAVTGGTLFRDILLNQNVSDKRYAEYDKAFDTYVKQAKK
jgi:hypothetical protein